jgi:hypothetical protein
VSDLRKQGARAPQDAFTVDGKKPSYQFCVNLWNRHSDAAKAKIGQIDASMSVWKAAMIAEVIDLARPEVRKP